MKTFILAASIAVLTACSQTSAQQAKRPAPNEVVATVGDSGGRSQPGLYLEIRRGATPVDPVPWFRRPAP